MMFEDRLFSGVRALSELKAIFNRVLRRISSLPNDFDTDFSQKGAAMAKLNEMAAAIYTLESVTYLTSLLADGNMKTDYEESNIALEATMVKLQAIKTIKIVLDHSYSLLGATTYLSNIHLNQLNFSNIHSPFFSFRI